MLSTNQNQVGHLGLPILDAQPFSNDSFSTRAFLLYRNYMQTDPVGVRTHQEIKSDAKWSNLDGSMISSGNSARRFDLDLLTIWYLWTWNEHGQTVAKERLEDFFKSDEIECQETFWLNNLEVEQETDLGDGVFLRPLALMNPSNDKEAFGSFGQHFIHMSLKPQCALVATAKHPKVMAEQPPREPSQAVIDLHLRMHDLALMINCLKGLICTQSYQTAYATKAPFGPFGGGGGGIPYHDVAGLNLTKFQPDHREELIELEKGFKKKDVGEKNRIRRIISRLSQAKKRTQIEDKILDLGITLEMVLLFDNQNHDQLSLSFRLRGSWWLEKDFDARKAISSHLKDLYQYRSQVAHSGVLAQGKPSKMDEIRGKLPTYEDIVERAVRKLIVEGTPDWTDLILGKS